MSWRYPWLFLFLTAAYVLYSTKYYKEILNIGVYQNVLKQDKVLFTKEELKNFKTLENGLYIAILGEVFDVSSGEKYYGPGSTYNGFTGCDASQAFITGDFSDEGLTDDISELTPLQIMSLIKWAEFYKKTYIYKGRLIGRFYDNEGIPTEELHKAKVKLKIAKDEEVNEEESKRKFPPCNVEWDVKLGTRIWCTKNSGGIARDWVGVPRMLYENPRSKQYRCVCVNLQSKEYKVNKGRIREYDNCDENQSNCFIEVEDLS